MITFGLCQMLGTFCWPLYICACCGHCFLLFAHLACIIVTAVFRFQEEGEKCASNGNYLGEGFDWTFKDHGDAIQGLFISQCVLFMVLTCLAFCTCNCASAISKEKVDKAFGRNSA